MWHTDRILYAMFIAAGIWVVAQFASDAAAVFFGAAASAYLISAGLGFSAYMRYEMIMFPAAAVAAGQWSACRSGTTCEAGGGDRAGRSAANRRRQAPARRCPLGVVRHPGGHRPAASSA